MSQGVDETSEGCNRFISVLKPNGEESLFLDQARLNHALIRPVHMAHTTNDLFHKLKGMCCLTLKEVSSGYNCIEQDEKSSNLRTFVCQFVRYRYIKLPFETIHAGQKFKRKNEILKSKEMF